MPLNPYALCPCGSGKKLKFCCPDLTSEMEKIQKMLDGEQRAACLEHIRGLETKYPERASLRGLQAMLEMQLGQTDDARATLDRFLDKHPGNPVGLAERAMLAAVTEGGRAAVACQEPAGEGARAARHTTEAVVHTREVRSTERLWRQNATGFRCRVGSRLGDWTPDRSNLEAQVGGHNLRNV